ncbi:MAG TPA: glutathione S-transferase [Methylococcales bacterium]|nr:glutathione S-transferase [Methylococcales bacterium]
MLATTETRPVVPVLYSFRRCPYAIRARIAIHYSGFKVLLREVVLRNKPPSLLSYSPKGTVPVLILPGGQVIDESYEIMVFSLQHNDPDNWLEKSDALSRAMAQELIAQNDGEFKFWLDRYKYSDRYPEQSAEYYRAQGQLFLAHLENKLVGRSYLLGDRVGLADMAIFPFVRQFAQVDRSWFDQSPYPLGRVWLERLLAAPFFSAVMAKYTPWDEVASEFDFP